MPSSLICPHCGHSGASKTHVKGSILFEVSLWILFVIPMLALSFRSGTPLLLVVPLIFSMWRLTTRQQVCSVCIQPGMIPISSPIGKELANKYPSPTVD